MKVIAAVGGEARVPSKISKVPIGGVG